MKKRIIAAVGVILIFSAFAIGSSSGSSSDSSSTVSVEKGGAAGGSGAADNSSAAVDSNAQSTETETEAAPQTIIAKPGDMVSDDHFEISYTGCSEYTSTNQFVKPADGKKFVKFDFTFKNISDTDTSIGSFECYCNDAKCEKSYVGISDDNVKELGYESVSGGREMSGSALYEVPADASFENIELEYSGFFDNKKSDKIIFVGA